MLRRTTLRDQFNLFGRSFTVYQCIELSDMHGFDRHRLRANLEQNAVGNQYSRHQNRIREICISVM
jgi:hypothetical protein